MHLIKVKTKLYLLGMLVKMARFVGSNFWNSYWHAIAQPYVCIFMNKFETDFLKKKGNCNHLFGLGIWIMYSTYTLIVQRHLKVSWKS